MAASDGNLEHDYPFPPRFYWTKRVTLWSCIVLGLTAVGWLKWQHDANAATAAYVDAMHSRGLPIVAADFAVDSIPDDQNAAVSLDQAAAGATTNSPSSSNTEFPKYLPMPPAWYPTAQAAVTGSGPVLALVRKARSQTKIDWKINFASPMINLTLPALNAQRNLVNLLADTAVYYHLQGNDAEAVETLRDIFAESDAVARQPILVSELVAGNNETLALERLQMIAPGLRIADDPRPAPTTQSITAVDRPVLRTLIDQVLKEGATNRIKNAFRIERAVPLDTASFMPPLLRPMYRFDGLYQARYMDQLEISSDQADYPRSHAVAPVGTNDLSSAAYLHGFSRNFGSLNRIVEYEFRWRTESRMTAVIVAARLYQVDHNGAWPASLSALVPDYLPSVPVDLFARDGRPLGYIMANNGARPIVYSVGSDGADQTTQGARIPVEPQIGWRYQPARSDDQWRDLSRFDPRPASPTSNPGN